MSEAVRGWGRGGGAAVQKETGCVNIPAGKKKKKKSNI